ncbi:protein PHYTOCHROME KINASE SUBSTRATE 4 [Iris pallida]|uniref:Protein PHYTOCHROME KINASE SUBSTRATE 4 n=1 Tax=Iris pallida TaxID=29817 RepID=A0AAX6E460_IRIPA|nr:protein PHYTOCHROME KINASE SUBSTRATE 4 [Iris pallida]
MERSRVRASYNNANLSQAASPSHLSLPPKPPVSPPQASLSRRIHDAAEISIFGAERYFNGPGADRDTAAIKNKKNGGVAESLDVPGDSSVSSYSRARSYRATPTASSEASWNSQTGLLANPAGAAAAVRVRACPSNGTKKGSGSSSSNNTNSTSSFGGGRSFFGRHCPCYGKKSVDVEDISFSETRRPTRSHCASSASRRGFPKMMDVDVLGSSNASGSTVPKKETVEMVMTKFKIRATEPGLFALPEAHGRIGRRTVIGSGAIGGSFSFPVLLSPATAPPPLAKELELEPARESLEVFRPSEEPTPSEVRRPVAPREDDIASDTSSDLFELESLSANSSAYRRRDSPAEPPKLASTAAAGAGMLQLLRSLEESVARSECYAPSEASVEWSVATAEAGFDRTSAANFSSAASDCGEARFVVRAEKERSDSGGNDGGAAKKRGGGGGGLLSCRCEKAVSVGPNPVRFGPDQQRLVAGPLVVPGPVPLSRSA